MDKFIREMDTVILALTKKGLKHTAKQASILKMKILKLNKISYRDENELNQFKFLATN